MAKRKTTWTRHGPDGAEVPIERRDLGLTRHGTTTYRGRGMAPWLAWVADMRAQTGLGRLVELERAACEILRSEGVRVPRELRLGPKLTALVDATADPPQTAAYFAARAFEAAAIARGEIEAGRAENAVYWALHVMWNHWAANLKRSLERDTLRGRKTKRSAPIGGKERQRLARSDDASEKDRADRARRQAQDALFLPLLAKGMKARSAARLAAKSAGGTASAILRRHQRNKKTAT